MKVYKKNLPEGVKKCFAREKGVKVKLINKKYLKDKTYVIVTHRPKLKELCNKHYLFDNHMMKEVITV